MNQLTLRQIPDTVEEKLRIKAAEEHQSLNKTAVSALAKGLGISDFNSRKRDLSKFVGLWGRDEVVEFKKNTALFETIDTEIWEG